MDEITFTVERDEEGAVYVATWDDPSGKGGITTEGSDLRELQDMIADAAAGYFKAAGVAGPSRVRLHFVADPEFVLA
jgi:predicted RNase H-like HicB family nuclease